MNCPPKTTVRLRPKEDKVDAFKPKVPSWPHSVAIGSPAGGWLVNGVRLEGTERIAVRATNYGTQEMVDAIRNAVDVVHAKHPGTKRLPVGDLSRRRRWLSHLTCLTKMGAMQTSAFICVKVTTPSTSNTQRRELWMYPERGPFWKR